VASLTAAAVDALLVGFLEQRVVGVFGLLLLVDQLREQLLAGERLGLGLLVSAFEGGEAGLIVAYRTCQAVEFALIKVASDSGAARLLGGLGLSWHRRAAAPPSCRGRAAGLGLDQQRAERRLVGVRRRLDLVDSLTTWHARHAVAGCTGSSSTTRPRLLCSFQYRA